MKTNFQLIYIPLGLGTYNTETMGINDLAARINGINEYVEWHKILPAWLGKNIVTLRIQYYSSGAVTKSFKLDVKSLKTSDNTIEVKSTQTTDITLVSGYGYIDLTITLPNHPIVYLRLEALADPTVDLYIMDAILFGFPN